ncbi:MAG: serine protease [Caldilineaceae bacterium]
MEKGHPADAAANPLLSAVVQLLTANDQVAGTSFAVFPRGLIVTCAHVVNVALGRDAQAAEKPSTAVRVTFAGTRRAGEGEIIAWSPYAQLDVAVLRVQEELLDGVLPLELSDLADLRNRPFRVYGFPNRVGYEAGRFARGEVGDRRIDGKLQAHSQELRQGDSGSFVQELQLGRIIGMVSAVDPGEERAVLIPARTIVQVCPEIGLKQAIYPFATLTDGLATLPGNVLANLEDFLDEYLGSPEHPVPFGGRKQALARLDTWLADTAVTHGVMAETAGKGKSALLTKWVTRVIADRRADVVFVPVSQRFDTALYSRFCALLGARLRQLCAPDAQSVVPNSAEQWWTEIDLYLREDRPPQRPLVIVVDGLDEAADWEAGRDLRLPKRLGRGIKILVSARLLGDDEDAGGWLARLRWRSYARAIPLEPLTQAGVAEVLAAMGNPLDKLATEVNVVAELYKLSEGDPLLVRLYVEALLDQGERLAFLTPEALRELQPGLDGYFDAWFEAQNRSWRAQGQEPLYRQETVITFLNLLACALGPLDREDVAAIAGPPLNQWHQLELVTKTVMRFVLGNGDTRGYTFSHPRLSQYFQERMLELERGEWQRQYLDYGLRTLRALSAKSVPPDQASRYVVQHYGAHLAQAEDIADERFYDLVTQQWMQAWLTLEGAYSGFLNDVDRAWHRAIAAERWGQQVRCALCHSSIATLSSNIPLKLLIRCLETSILHLSQALQIALNNADLLSRSLGLTIVAHHVEDTRQRTHVLQLALETALNLPMENSIGIGSPRGDALVALAPHLTSELLPTALEAALNLPVEGSYGRSPRVEALAALAPRLDERQRTQVLQTTLEAALNLPLEDKDGIRSPRVEALTALAPHLTSELLPTTLEAALNLPVEDRIGRSPREKALVALAPHLTSELLATALEAALNLPVKDRIGIGSPRVLALAALAPKCQDTSFACFKTVLAKTLMDYSCIRRPTMLRNLSTLVEELPILHMSDTPAEIFKAVHDIITWWP